MGYPTQNNYEEITAKHIIDNTENQKARILIAEQKRDITFKESRIR